MDGHAADFLDDTFSAPEHQKGANHQENQDARKNYIHNRLLSVIIIVVTALYAGNMSDVPFTEGELWNLRIVNHGGFKYNIRKICQKIRKKEEEKNGKYI